MTVIRRANEPKILTSAMLVAVAAYVVAWFCIRPTVFAQSGSDFGTFYRAGRMTLAGDGPRVYDLVAERRYDNALGTTVTDADGNSVSLPFVFAPFALILYAPLAFLPYQTGEAAWYAANVAMLLALPLLLRRQRLIGGYGCALGLIAPPVFLPVTLALLQGQPSILILLLFALGYVDLTDGKDARAGVWFALASFKPQLVVPVVLALVAWRKTRTLRAFMLSLGTLTLGSAFMVGWRATFSYPRALLLYASMGNGLGAEHPASMPNLRGFLYVLLHDHRSSALRQIMTLAISLLLLAIMAGLLRRHRQVSTTSFSLLVVVALLTSYHAYLHDDSLLLLPLLLVGVTDSQIRSAWLRRLTAAATLAIFMVPLLPTSLTTTAAQMFLAITALAGLLACQIFQGRSINPTIDLAEYLPAQTSRI